MSDSSSIEWTESTWNPVTGCTKISIGCTNCYAERMAKRLLAMGAPAYQKGFQVTIHPESLNIPRKWRKPRQVFVNSMSDLFHNKVPLSFIEDVFRVMRDCSQHTFQILTKRAERASQLAHKLEWAPNIWMGVTIESPDVLDRIDALRTIPSRVRFISAEPLLGPLSRIDLTDIHWVIAGGESGPGARPLDVKWVTELRDICVEKGVSFLFKQWGGINKKKAGRLLEGRIWDQMPEVICSYSV